MSIVAAMTPEEKAQYQALREQSRAQLRCQGWTKFKFPVRSTEPPERLGAGGHGGRAPPRSSKALNSHAAKQTFRETIKNLKVGKVSGEKFSEDSDTLQL